MSNIAGTCKHGTMRNMVCSVCMREGMEEATKIISKIKNAGHKESKRKVAFDIHGVIDADPEFFSWLSHRLRDNGYIIYIITGGKYVENARLLKRWNVYYDHFYSITDHHTQLGTPLIPGCADGEVCIADEIWDRAKGDYCKKHDIHLIVDDTPRYEDYMHKTLFEHW